MNYTSLTNLEVLANVVGISAAKRLYRGTLTQLFVPPADTSREHAQLAAAVELVRRWLHEELRRENVFASSANIRDYLRLVLAKEEREVFFGLFLDTQHRLIKAAALFFGTVDETSVYPREVVKYALSLNASAAVFAHNHPSGVAEPSQADRHLTATLRTTLALVDIQVLDHFIVGGAHVTSLADRGML